VVVIGARTATRQPDGRGGFETVPAFDPPRAWIERLVDEARAAGCRIDMKPNLQRAWNAELIDEYPVESKGRSPSRERKLYEARLFEQFKLVISAVETDLADEAKADALP
jgi:hypothetical protein